MGKRFSIKRSGILAAAVAGALGGWCGQSRAAVFTWTGGGTAAAPLTGNWNVAGNWTGGLPVSVGTTELDFGGSGGTAYTATDDIAGNFSLNILKLNSTDALVAETINASAAANQLNFVNNGTTGAVINQTTGGAFNLNIGMVLTGTSTVSFGGAGTGLVSLGGVISGGAPLTFNGGTGSQYALTGAAANTYTGATTISSGTVTVSAGAVALAGSGVTFSGGLLNLNSAVQAVNANVTQSNGTIAYQQGNQIADNRNVTISGGTFALGAFSDTVGALNVSGGTLSGAGGGVITPTSSTVSGGTISAIVAGTGGLTKNGNGTTTMTGVNTLGGATSANAGILLLNGNGSIANSSGVTIGSNVNGTLTLDNSGTNVGDRLKDSAAVTFANTGGTLNYTGHTASSAETIGALGTTGGIGNVKVTNQAAASTQLNAASLSHTFGALDFSGAGTGTLGAAGNAPRVVFATPPTLTGGIIGGWATVGGADFATHDNTNGVTAYTGYTALPTNTFSGTTVYQATGDVALTGGGNVFALKLNAAANQTIDLGANNLSVDGGGIIKSGGTGTTTVNGAGTLTMPNEAVIYVNQGTLVVNAPLSTPRLTKPGAGKLVLPVAGAATWMPNPINFAGTLELNVTSDQTISGQAGGTGTLVKSGPSALVLTNANNGFGRFAVNGGTLEAKAQTTSQNVNLDAAALQGYLGNNTGGGVTIDGATLKLTTALNGVTAGNIAMGRAITFGANGGVLDLTNTVGGTLGGGTATINAQTVGGGGGDIPLTTTAGGQLATVKFNGGSVGLSDPTNFNNWNSGGNTLRFNALTGTGPLAIQLSNGALFRSGTGGGGTVSVPMAFTVAGPSVASGGDSSSGLAATANAGASLTTGRIANDNYAVLNWAGGLTLQGALQVGNTGAARAWNGNIVVAGTASGNPGFVSFSGRGTGQGLAATLIAPNSTTTTNGLHALYLGQGGANDTLTIQDGGVASMDLRIRTDQANHHPVVMDSKTTINAGGTLRFTQSLSNTNIAGFPGQTAGNVAYEIVRNSITGQGTTAKDSAIEIYLPPVSSFTTFGPLGSVDFSGGSAGSLGTASNSASLVVNGSGLGGLVVKGLTRPTALLGGADPVSNDLKVANLLTQGRLSTMTGTGGYLTPAPQGSTFSFPVNGEWGSIVPVGLKVVDSNAAGADVALPATSTWAHNLHVASGATLVANGVTFNNNLTSGTVVSGFGNIASGTGANGLTVSTGATVAPGASAGILTLTGDAGGANDVNLRSGSILAVEIASASGTPLAGADYDQLAVTAATAGGVTNLNADAGLGAILSLALNAASDPAVGTKYAIVLNDANHTLAGTFAGQLDGSLIVAPNAGNGGSLVGFTVNYNADGGDGSANDVVLTVAAVPEPAAIGLLGMGALGLFGRRRRRA